MSEILFKNNWVIYLPECCVFAGMHVDGNDFAEQMRRFEITAARYADHGQVVVAPNGRISLQVVNYNTRRGF